MVGSGAGCEWVQHAYLEMVEATFDPADIQRRLNNWEEGKNAREDGVCGNTWRSPVRNHSTMLFVEKLEAKTHEWLLSVTTKHSLVITNCSIRWCPHNVMYDCGSTDKAIDRDVEGCWRRMVLRALLACSAVRLQVTLCELVEIEPRLVKDRTATECKEEKKMISRAAVFMRQRLMNSKFCKCSASSRDCSDARLVGRATAHSLWWTCPKCDSVARTWRHSPKPDIVGGK